MKSLKLRLLLAGSLLTGTLVATAASAADLGGNCCADLEERVADLEATTVRKGNRKVSLTVTGWVSQQIAYWDDGKGSGTYVEGTGIAIASNVKFLGEAQIVPGWKAGYLIHIELLGNSDPLTLSQNAPTSAGFGPTRPLQSYWFVESKDYGRVSVGLLSHASDNSAIYPDESGTLVASNWANYENLSFLLRDANSGQLTNLNWGAFNNCAHTNLEIGGDCNGLPRNAVRYDTPVYNGFSASASWGQDQFWDVTGRYAGSFEGFKTSIAVSYSATNDSSFANGNGGNPGYLNGLHSDYFQTGAYVEHLATGLFLYGAYGHEFNNNTHYADGALIKDNDHWMIKPGIRATGLSPLGHTVFWGEYSQTDDQLADVALRSFDRSTWTQVGGGVQQEIDSAAMSLWLKYREQSVDASCSGAGVGAGSICGAANSSAKFDNIRTVVFGGLIAF